MSCFTGAGYTENKISMLLTPGDFAEHVTETSWMLKRGVPMKKFTKKEIFSIPNIMGYFRILLIPVFCYLYITAESEREYLYAAFVVLISSLTDLFDGKIARRFNMITELGKALDPIADKLTHGALAVCLATRYPLMWVLIVLMIIKEGYMGIQGLIFPEKRKNAGWRNVVWKGLYSNAFCGYADTVPVSGSSIMACERHDLCNDGSHACDTVLYVPVFKKMKEE